MPLNQKDPLDNSFNYYQVRTDLAIEAREMVHEEEEVEIPGVEVEEEQKEEIDLKITKVKVVNEEGAKAMGKPIGHYITMECQKMKENDSDVHDKLMRELATQIHTLVDVKENPQVLVVGLGNWWVTPDSLGPKATSNLLVTRHLFEQMAGADYLQHFGKVSALSPGVMGQTGMETSEIIDGVVDKVKPDIVIAIDALASRRTERLNTTIQLSDTGIHPGAGVGNKRAGLNKETLGVPVIAIGIPTVVEAATIVNDTIDNLISVMMQQTEQGKLISGLKDFSKEEKYQLIKEILNPYMGNMFVTPKDIDAVIKRISNVISGAINMALHPNIDYQEISSFLY